MIPYRNGMIVAVLLHGLAAPAGAEVFRYEDSKGRPVFTDRVLFDPGYKLVWRSSVGSVPYSNAIVPRRPPAAGRGNVASYREKKQRYSDDIERVARDLRLSPELIHAVVKAESAYNPRAVSSAGAMGLMQLMPATAARYGVENAWDPVQNLKGGASYLRDLLDMFQNNLRLALAAYNAGEGAVQRHGNQIPPYPETQDYVRKVLKFYLEERRQESS